MRHKQMIIMLAAVLIVAGIAGQTQGQGKDYLTWVEFTIVRITEPSTGCNVPVGKTITLKCVAAVDIDCGPNEWGSSYVEDWLTFTWSATRGTFVGNVGTEVQWTAPAVTGPVNITVTASDDSIPTEYANDTNRIHTITVNVVNPGIVYVNDDAGGLNNGTSWANAYTNLNTAISQASPGSELWVATGTYTPDPNNRGNSIAINKNVKVYGGFAGTETAVYQRDWVANVTVLSGDIAWDNSYNVVKITNSSAILDGFTITQGSGWADGAGVYVENCSPTIRNCTFTDNLADGQDADGGGISCWNASPTVSNCVFIDNTAGDDGGAAANKSNSNSRYVNCAFYSNVAQGDDGKGDGGAVFNSASEAYPRPCTPAFVNCVFANNSTQRYGGAVALQEATAPSSVATYLNCTFHGNVATTAGDVISCRHGNTTTLKNCILWDNNTDGGTDDIYNVGSTVNISYSDVQGGYPGAGNINTNPIFAFFGRTIPTDLDGADNRWLTCDDGLRIKFSSPCVDAGDGDAKDAFTEAGANVRDALGLKHIDIRTVADTGTGTPRWYDMGAYEAAVEHAIFISVDGLGALHLQHDTLMGANSPSWTMQYMKRIRDEGLWTFNARSDHDFTETTPNHITMLTGRPVIKPTGWSNTSYHGWTYNGEFYDQTWTLHGEYNTSDGPQGNPYLAYLPSVYDVVHDAGGTTAEYAGKDKFSIHEWSYDLIDGAYHATYGKDKLDTYEWTTDKGEPWEADYSSWALVNKFIDWMNVPEYDFNFVFLHLKGPDKVGHRDHWDSDSWDWAVMDADWRLYTVLQMVESPSNRAWYGNTLVVVTADHGGENPMIPGDPAIRHDNATLAQNYTIPFGVWGHLVPHGDAYTCSGGTRTNPGTGRVPYTAQSQPLRHADGVDLALNLMGMPAISGASITGMSIR